jgi:hypothetical protein
MAFNPIRMQENDIGATIKGSKRRFAWNFELDGVSNNIVMEASLLTNKRKVTLNGESKFQGFKSLGGSFRYSFYMGQHIVTLENSHGRAD